MLRANSTLDDSDQGSILDKALKSSKQHVTGAMELHALFEKRPELGPDSFFLRVFEKLDNGNCKTEVRGGKLVYFRDGSLINADDYLQTFFVNDKASAVYLEISDQGRYRSCNYFDRIRHIEHEIDPVSYLNSISQALINKFGKNIPETKFEVREFNFEEDFRMENGTLGTRNKKIFVIVYKTAYILGFIIEEENDGVKTYDIGLSESLKVK